MRCLGPLHELADAGEVEIEELVVGRVDGALHHRRAQRVLERLARPETDDVEARKVSMLSANDTRMPFWRSRSVNSMSLASIRVARPARRD